ncbi:MAG: hypothetical protein QM642_08365 [Edaphocola sp.]
MKQLPFFAAGLVAATYTASYAQQLSDRWIEANRTTPRNKNVAFADTLRLLDVTNEGLMLRRGAFAYKGTINKKTLEVGDIQYRILKKADAEIQLEDEEYIHIFVREKKDNSAADYELKQQEHALPKTPVKYIDTALLTGKWEAYRRQNTQAPAERVDYSTLIQSLNYNQHDDAPGVAGTIVTPASNSTLRKYFITSVVGGSLTAMSSDGKSTIKVDVLKLTATELVLTDEKGIIYFMKQF